MDRNISQWLSEAECNQTVDILIVWIVRYSYPKQVSQRTSSSGVFIGKRREPFGLTCGRYEVNVEEVCVRLTRTVFRNSVRLPSTIFGSTGWFLSCHYYSREMSSTVASYAKLSTLNVKMPGKRKHTWKTNENSGRHTVETRINF
jgi:hypothetical protein